MRGYVVELPDFLGPDCPAFLSQFYTSELPLWVQVYDSVHGALIFSNYLAARFWAIRVPYRCFVRFIKFK